MHADADAHNHGRPQPPAPVQQPGAQQADGDLIQRAVAGGAHQQVRLALRSGEAR